MDLRSLFSFFGCFAIVMIIYFLPSRGPSGDLVRRSALRLVLEENDASSPTPQTSSKTIVVSPSAGPRRLSNQTTRLENAQHAMCGGDLDFVYVVDNVGVPWWSYSTNARPNLVWRAARKRVAAPTRSRRGYSRGGESRRRRDRDVDLLWRLVVTSTRRPSSISPRAVAERTSEPGTSTSRTRGRAENLSIRTDFATCFRRTASAVRRCQNQRKRRSYGRKRKDARRYDLDAQGHGDYKGNLHEQMVDVFRRADIPRTGRGGTAALT